MPTGIGSTIWVYGHSGDETIAACCDALRSAFEEKGLPVEEINAASIARKAYEEKASWFSLTMAVGFTTNRLNKHGIHVIVRSSKGPSSGFNWGKYKPERLLDVVLDGDPVKVEPPTPTVRVNSTTSMDDQGIERVNTDVSLVVGGLEKMGWLSGEAVQGDAPVDDEEIRKRLENLGYL